MTNPFLIGKSIYLRNPLPGDEQVIALSENDPAARAMLYYALPSSPQQVWEKIHRMQADQQSVVLSVCTKEPDQVVGIAALLRIDWIGRMATFYIAIAEEKNWSKGFGSQATRLIVDHAFAGMNLNRVQLHVSVENRRALQVYKKSGFRIEGTLRQAMFRDNHYSDFYLMAILKEDWLAMKNRPGGPSEI